jgi:SAM-dependent methyltransferase
MKTADIFDNARLYKLFQFSVTRHETSQLIRDEVIKPSGIQRVLDFGCGIGYHSKEFVDSEYLGIEPLQGCVEKAHRIFKNSNNNFIVGNHKTLKSIPDSSYDLIISMGVLHHLSDEIFKEFVCESHRILKIGGRLTTFDPVYHKEQSKISKWVVSRDRGNWVRTIDEYLNPIHEVYHQDPTYKVYKKLLRIPYDHVAIETRKK